MMGKTFLSLFVLAGSLFAADPFVGTWKLNVAQSKYSGGQGPAPKEITLVVAVADGQVTDTLTGTAADGSPLLMKYRVPRTRGPLQWLEGGPPSASGITSTLAQTKADSDTAEFIDTKDGKVIQTTRAVASATGKSMRVVTKGTDPQGKKYETVEVYDKQ
jgi:hypothetical protein